jgi:hypothetical protein
LNSFGILMWEIASQMKPFANIESGVKVFEEVAKGERPDINLINIPSEDDTSFHYIDEYVKIMKEAWHQEPNQRPEIASLCERLRNLYLNYKKQEGEDDFATLSMRFPSVNESETKDNDTSGETMSQNVEESKSNDELSLEKAKDYHKEKNYTAAWSIYDTLAKSGNLEAKYKACYYLTRGPPYCPQKDLIKAENYIREAADEDHVEAQYRYYQLLFKKANGAKHKMIIAEAYLKLAVEQNHADALYDYGEHLFKGTFGNKDPEKGYEMLMAAHYRMNGKALKRLTELMKAEFPTGKKK